MLCTMDLSLGMMHNFGMHRPSHSSSIECKSCSRWILEASKDSTGRLPSLSAFATPIAKRGLACCHQSIRIAAAEPVLIQLALAPAPAKTLLSDRGGAISHFEQVEMPIIET